MFGRRPDGRRLDTIDPIVRFMPYIMKTRNDASNLITEYVDYEPIAEYIRKRSKENRRISFMALIMAAYVRAVSEYPALNRFIINKQVFARNEIVVSLTVLRKSKERDTDDEALLKMRFEPDATLDEVNAELESKLAEGTDGDADNGTVKFANALLKCRPLVSIVVGLAKLLDNWGLLPKWLYDISPFHCSMFLTNMASIGMPSLYHHLYNFGNTTVFIAMGKFEKQLTVNSDGVSTKTVIPLGVTTDERICGGADYAKGFAAFKKYLIHPELLEERPAEVKSEIPHKKTK